MWTLILSLVDTVAHRDHYSHKRADCNQPTINHVRGRFRAYALCICTRETAHARTAPTLHKIHILYTYSAAAAAVAVVFFASTLTLLWLLLVFSSWSSLCCTGFFPGVGDVAEKYNKKDA